MKTFRVPPRALDVERGPGFIHDFTLRWLNSGLELCLGKFFFYFFFPAALPLTVKLVRCLHRPVPSGSPHRQLHFTTRVGYYLRILGICLAWESLWFRPAQNRFVNVGAISASAPLWLELRDRGGPHPVKGKGPVRRRNQGQFQVAA